ncbi:MAG: hypothetical protein IKK33_07370 [Lachnospiraceae bacterium]|nr:hypothetical protein [Lachnospiraceae bacterium]
MIVIQWFGKKLFEEECVLWSNAEITRDERPAIKISWNVLSILSILAGVYVFFMEAVLILSKRTRQLPVGEGLTKLWIALSLSFLCVQFRFVVKYLELSKHKSESKGKLFWGYHIVWNVILLVGLVMVWSSFDMNSAYLGKIYDFQILQVIIVVAQSIGRKEI